MTQAALGKEIGVTDSIIGYYVRGVHDPSFDLGAKISYFFGVEAYEMAFENLEELLPPVEEPEAPKGEKIKDIGGMVSAWIKWTKRRNPGRETIENTEEAIKKIVGGEISFASLTTDLGIIFNEDSLEDFTCQVDGKYFYGPVIFVGLDENENFTDCAMTSETFKTLFPNLWKH